MALLSFTGRLWGRVSLQPKLIFGALAAMNEGRPILAPMSMNDSAPASGAKRSKQSAVCPAPITTLRVKRLTPDATLPKRGSERAAGYDLSRCVLSIITTLYALLQGSKMPIFSIMALHENDLHLQHLCASERNGSTKVLHVHLS